MRAAGGSFDLAVVGCGAAGLMAAIRAGRAQQAKGLAPSIVALDGASRIGAKILIAGGGRCNVTHDVVDESAFSGSTQPAIRNVLRRFGVDDTVRFFADAGVRMKREETGKLFPVTDRARTVLDALLREADRAGVSIVNPWRVENITRREEGFVLSGSSGELAARRVILATGGKSVPKTGSDGHGYELARRLGHTTTPRILPGLVPLLLADDGFVRDLSGLTVPATITLRASTGRILESISGSTLCTHFGISGPPVLDMSRHWLHARLEDEGAYLEMSWVPGRTLDTSSGLVGRTLSAFLPERLAAALCREAGVEFGASFDRLSRDSRASFVRAVSAYRLPVTGDRGFTHAEVTAGGVPLSEVKIKTMESRVCPGLYLAGEILDVDGRIGGFNFQWAWASGHVAGMGQSR